jgi:hypothetical protein
MNNIYTTPESDLISNANSMKDSEVEKLKIIFKEQRIVLAPLITFLTTLLFFIPMLLSFDAMPMWVFVSPAFAIGLIVKYTCRLVHIKHRIISGTVLVLIISLLMLLYNPITAVNVAAFSFVIFVAISKRTLHPDQKNLLYKLKIGKLKL